MAASKIKWSRRAIKQATAAIDFIRADSVTNAGKVYDKLMKKLETISNNPEMSPLDKYKLYNDGSYRAFTIYKYRVSYRVLQSEILILRFRHTSMLPKYY